MKKVLMIVLSLALVFAIASCSSTKSTKEPETTAAVEAAVETPAPVAEAPVEAEAVEQKTEIVIVANNEGDALPFGEDLTNGAYWRQVVCSASMEAKAREIAGDRNVVVLANDESVIANVRNGLFLIGILPSDAAI